MRFDAITLFPAMFAAVSEQGITRRARELGLWSMGLWNPRDFTTDVHRTVDDRPFGGGPGMVMMAEPLAATLAGIRASGNSGRVLAFAPGGTRLTDSRVREFVAAKESLVLVCGRYEGTDQRFLDQCVDEVVSIGDFVLSGGELAAMTLVDAVVRQLPGAIKDLSTSDESFADGLLDAPHYTRPEVWRDLPVPDVLMSGHHAKIDAWRREQALLATAAVRPDMIDSAREAGLLTKRDEGILRIAQIGAVGCESGR
ncbi:MAG: tRNA (guanosine(37)-N1)-methyltransferase TrmD [Burkholderiaceae bacterium]